MVGYQYLLALVLALCIEAANAICEFPGVFPGATVVSKTNKATYADGELLLYECEKRKDGHVARYCRGSTWSDPSRQCTDSFLWNNGALAGVMVAAFNYAMAIFAVVYSKCKFKDAPKDDDAQKDVTTSSPSSEDRVTADTKLSDDLDEDNNKTRQDLNHDDSNHHNRSHGNPARAAVFSNINVKISDETKSMKSHSTNDSVA